MLVVSRKLNHLIIGSIWSASCGTCGILQQVVLKPMLTYWRSYRHCPMKSSQNYVATALSPHVELRVRATDRGSHVLLLNEKGRCPQRVWVPGCGLHRLRLILHPNMVVGLSASSSVPPSGLREFALPITGFPPRSNSSDHGRPCLRHIITSKG